MDNVRIETSQCDHTDFVSITPVELKGREFPMDKEEILANLKDKELNAVRTTLQYKCHAWCLFSVVDNDLVIHRLTVKDDTELDAVVHDLFKTITYSPVKRGCTVSLNWPEYATDHFLFRHLLATGWQTDGLIKDHYYAYGENWDGIKLWRDF